MRIGLVSDTHGLFDPALPRLLAGCERILHAGDVVGDEVLAELRAIAPVHAVRGNNDPGQSLPEHLVLDLGPLRTLVVHELGKPEHPAPAARRLLAASGASLVVFGHSHQPLVEQRGDVLFVNPGSAGPRRFRLPRCAGVLEIEGAAALVRIVDLDSELSPLIEARF